MASLSNSLSIESIEIASLRPVARNLRRHTRGQLRKIKKSLNHFGHVRPILVTPDLEIIDGQLICEALKANGATTVCAIVARGLSPVEIRALRLMLNRSAEDAIWDTDALRIELRAILDAGFDLDLTGSIRRNSTGSSARTFRKRMFLKMAVKFLRLERLPFQSRAIFGNAAVIASAAAMPAIRNS
jgi:ParB-like chromosome segregation protein Spo0J